MTHPDRLAPVSPLAALARRWYVGVPLAVLGLLAGIQYAAAGGVTYTAEARLVVGSDELAAYEVPGYAAASEQLAANYSRYLGVREAQGQLRFTLQGFEGITAVRASPIPDSSVIRVEVAGQSQRAALGAADAVADYLRDLVNRGASDRDALLQTYAELSATVGRARAEQQASSAQLGRAVSTGQDAAVPALQRRLAAAETSLASATLRQQAVANQFFSTTSTGSNELRDLGPAVVSGDDRSTRAQRYGVLGLGLGLGLGLLAAVTLERRRRRAELGSPEAHPAADAGNPQDTPPVVAPRPAASHDVVPPSPAAIPEAQRQEAARGETASMDAQAARSSATTDVPRPAPDSPGPEAGWVR